MSSYRFFLFVTLLASTFLGCKKEFVETECERLKLEMSAKNIEAIKTIVTNFVNRLPSKDYNEANLNKLAASLSGECNISAAIVCFDCIDTLPSLSEIRISFNSSGVIIHSIIDISYTQDNKLNVFSVHQ